MAEKMNGLSLELLSHPGETLQEVLESNNMTQKELAARIDVSPKHINQIISGLVGISSDVAFKLEKVFSLSAKFWMNLQSKYDSERMMLLEEEDVTDEEISMVHGETYKQLVKWKYITDLKTDTKKVVQMRDFLGVSNLLNIDKTISANALFRKSTAVNTNNFALAAWMKICEIETDMAETNRVLDIEKLKNNINNIRALNIYSDPNIIVEKLKGIFAECGIAFAVVRNIKGAPVQGFIRKINNKMRLCMTLRNKYADIFWFTLFHEIGHLLSVGDEFFVDFSGAELTTQEKNADKFATETLLAQREYLKFVGNRNFSKFAICKFAQDHEILPGILVGRLQHDKLIKNSYCNDLRTQYKWATE